jgi:hypothetical protein
MPFLFSFPKKYLFFAENSRTFARFFQKSSIELLEQQVD